MGAAQPAPVGTLSYHRPERVLEIVNAPNMIQAGDFSELLAIRFYPQTPLTEKYLVVACRETAVDDGFTPTAYLARRPSTRREMIWKR